MTACYLVAFFAANAVAVSIEMRFGVNLRVMRRERLLSPRPDLQHRKLAWGALLLSGLMGGALDALLRMLPGLDREPHNGEYNDEYGFRPDTYHWRPGRSWKSRVYRDALHAGRLRRVIRWWL